MCFLPDSKLFLLLFVTLRLSAMQLSEEEAERIGKEIFLNECGLKVDKLVWWNAGEEFASLGIGHFIWYPKDKRGPFEEIFPHFIQFLKSKSIPLPDWLGNHCPWNNRQEFTSSQEEQKKAQLCVLLMQTIPEQTAFMSERIDAAMERILAGMEEKKRIICLKNIEKLQSSWRGKYVLIDYLNFKGEGTLASERYKGQGWGLAQVLEEMPENRADVLCAFVEAAKRVLQRRIYNAPANRHEERWLKGWLNRLDNYLKSADVSRA